MTSPTTSQLLPVSSGREVRRYLRGLLPGRRWLLVATLLATLAGGALTLPGPLAIGWVTQAIADNRSTAALVGPLVLLSVTAIAAAVVTRLGAVLLARLIVPASAQLREDAVGAAASLPLEVVEAGGSGDLVARVSDDIEVVADATRGALGEFLASGVAIASALVGLATLDWRFAVAELLAVPIQWHTLRWYLRVSQPMYAAGREAAGRRASALLAGFTALPTLRALRLGRRQRGLIEEASLDALGYQLAAMRAATRFFGRLNLAELVGLSAVLLTGFWLVHTGQVSIGAATAAALFFVGLFDPINTVLGVTDTLQMAGAGLARLVGVVSTAPPAEPEGARPATVGEGALEVSDLRFGYGDGSDVLTGISLRVAPGERLAVVGASGSGKSTLASLLAGLRQPRAGSVTHDGTPLSSAARPSVALVTQETHVFVGTLADNLLLARPDADVRDLVEVVAAVGAREWAGDLDMIVGSGGHELTASQAQQLALARVLLLDPTVVVLDEATAEAGSDAARALDRAADAVVVGRSAVVVAHRLSQAVQADTILVMEAGRVIERGSHAELLAEGGAYAALWSAWASDGR